MKIIAALFTLICVCTTSSAQTFTERLQKNNTGKGTVKVVHSAAIDKLVNGNQPDIKPEKPTTAKQTEQKAGETEKKTTSHVKQDNATYNEQQDTPTIDMRNKVMGRSYKVTG